MPLEGDPKRHTPTQQNSGRFRMAYFGALSSCSGVSTRFASRSYSSAILRMLFRSHGHGGGRDSPPSISLKFGPLTPPARCKRPRRVWTSLKRAGLPRNSWSSWAMIISAPTRESQRCSLSPASATPAASLVRILRRSANPHYHRVRFCRLQVRPPGHQVLKAARGHSIAPIQSRPPPRRR